MKMFARIRYLLMEGFEVCSITSFQPQGFNGPFGTAKITWLERRPERIINKIRYHSEQFIVNKTEVDKCCEYFHKHIEQHRKN